MLKIRLIPVLYIKNGLIVRSEKFSYHQNLGNVVSEAQRYNDWNVDELVYIDISRDEFYDLRRDDLKVSSKNNIVDLIRQISQICFCPLTFGGRIRTIEDIRVRLLNGADKISINTAAFRNPAFVTESSNMFGSQCIVVSIDFRLVEGKPRVFVDCGREDTGLDPVSWAREVERLGAGEILLNSIDRDGTANGYDLAVTKAVAAAVKIPVIGCGGAGDFFDFAELIKETEVSAVAAGNLFHFTEHSYERAKEYLKKQHVNVR
jgi:cyclase